MVIQKIIRNIILTTGIFLGEIILASAQQSGMFQYLQSFAEWNPAQNEIMILISGTELHILSADGLEVSTLKTSKDMNNPLISPDGKNLSYIISSEGLFIYSFIDKETISVFFITNTSSTINNVQWSHDSKKLLFKVEENAMIDKPGSAKYYVFDIERKETKIIFEIKGN